MEKYVGLVNHSEQILYLAELKPGVTIDNFNSFSKDYELNDRGGPTLGNMAGNYRFVIYDNDIAGARQSLRLTTDEVLAALLGYLRLTSNRNEKGVDRLLSAKRFFGNPRRINDWFYILLFFIGIMALVCIVILNYAHFI